MGNRFSLTAAMAAITLVVTSACTVHQTEPPALMGPSDFALSIDVSATPDSISQDGASQSSIIVTAHDANGALKSGVALRLDMQVGGVTQDFGTLSARTVVTGSDGRASAIYTAPAASPIAGGSGTMISILATAIGTNAQASSQGRTASIRLVPPGVILPPAGTPTAVFTFTPTPVTVNVPVTFDATTSAPGAGAAQIVSYSWNFGDGGTGTGVSTSHTFSAAGTYNVTLTVTNDRGLSASTSQGVPASTSAPPSAAFVTSPTTICSAASCPPGATVFFNATTSVAAAGRTIVRYDWNFGDGQVASTGPTTTHVYGLPNKYTITLTVTDDLGQKNTAKTDLDVK